MLEEEAEEVFTFEYLNPIEGDKSQRKSGRSNCWNCGDASHTIRDCPKPKDPKSISKNRRLFQSAGNDNKRYHEISSDKYGHLKPGQVSKALRDALGLGERQLPKHIYRMRSLGYPPGWVLEAEVKDNKLCIFGLDGEVVLGEDEDEGELRKRVRYDTEKIIEYPGFNVKADSKYLKEEERYEAPEFNPLHSKDLLAEALTSTEEQFELPYGESQASSKTIQELSEVSPNMNSVVSEKEPITEVVMVDTGTEVCGASDCVVPERKSVSESGMLETLTLKSGDVKEQDTPKDIEESLNLPVSSSVSSSDLIEGTTIYSQEFSEFSGVPPLDNFKIDVDELLYFQNLPASTGCFQAMRAILLKIREAREES